MAEQTIVERSGRAALAASDIGISDGESYEDFDKRRAIAAGRAAIEAMREPSIPMVAAAWGEPADVNHLWRTMIGAALEERHEASPPKA